MFFDLNGKNAFITGGASGIGEAVARRYAAAGAKVTIADRVDGSEVANSIGGYYVGVDVGDEESIATALDEAVETTGRLDIIVNNAGIGDVGPTLAEAEQNDLERMTRINQWGVLYGIKHGQSRMNDGGSIINTSSLGALYNLPGQGLYAAAKRAVISMTETSALELGSRNIRSNAVCPGYIATALGSGEEGDKIASTLAALGRVGTTDDLVGLYHFLAANESAYITGQTHIVDGGWRCGATSKLLEIVTGSETAS